VISLRSLLATGATIGLVALAGPFGQASGTVAAPTVTWSDADPVMAGTSTTSTSSLYKFSTMVSGKPVRWNPCKAIHYRIRVNGMPTGAGPMVKAAVARVAKATGISIIYDGQSTSTPTSAWLPKSSTGIRPVLIGWTDAAHSDLLRNQPSAVLGVTRTAYFATVQNGLTLAATKAAVIALDRTNKLPLTGTVSWNTTLLHELGHAMGLDHVGNSHELMYPVLQRSLWGLQSGDLAGLYRLGKSAGCINLGF
jgi:hypothetical protein